MAEKEKETVVENEISAAELDILLNGGTPSASSVIIAEEKKTVLTNTTDENKRLIETIDSELSEEERIKKAELLKAEEEKKKEEEKNNGSEKKGAEILNEVLTTGGEREEEGEEELDENGKKKSSGGRPALSKDIMIATVNKLFEEKVLTPFEDDKDLSKYTVEDWADLIKENLKAKEEKVWEEVPVKFFDNLSPELQFAAKYESDGGKDIKGLFRLLAQSEETKALDVATEDGQEQIVRRWLTHTEFGTPEEIEAEVNAMKDRKELEPKAKQFKPKLDAKQQEIVDRQLKEQETRRKQQEIASQKYIEKVIETLKPGELNGIKLDKKTQGMLYTGLVEPNYPSLSGQPTNMLGHLLEKYQYVEPRYDLLAEALFLFSDPEGYRAKIREQGSTEQVKKTVKVLKTEEGLRNSSSTTIVDKKDEGKKTTLKRPVNIFSGK